jgi:hypothetical protein
VRATTLLSAPARIVQFFERELKSETRLPLDTSIPFDVATHRALHASENEEPLRPASLWVIVLIHSSAQSATIRAAIAGVKPSSC